MPPLDAVMINRVIVPMDESEAAERALQYALEVHSEAEITVLHVVGEPSSMMGTAVGLALETDYEEAAREKAAELFDRARDTAAAHDIEIETEIAFGNPGKAIVERAEDADVVVMGSHGGSLSGRLFVGNAAERVFRHSPVPVTVVR